MMKIFNFVFCLGICLIAGNHSCAREYQVATLDDPGIFPLPLHVRMDTGDFRVDQATSLLVSGEGSKGNEVLSELLRSDFTDHFSYAVPMIKASSLKGRHHYILIGSIDNPLIKEYCQENHLEDTLTRLGEEGYLLSVTQEEVVVASVAPRGAMYGLESLRQLIHKNEEGVIAVPRLWISDKPACPFRGIKLYLPGRDNIPFFKRFIKDFAAYYKFNTIILELNANMRLTSHPELNVGAIEMAKHLKYSRLDRPPGLHHEYQNSSHQDNADGEILEKEEVGDLVKYIRSFNMDVLPELPSLTHSYYLLYGHHELAENPNQPWPDTYCPLKPEIYKIYFDVLDEYIDVIHPKVIHVGHDEWRMEKDVCPLCRGKDYGKLFAEDLIKIHDHLAAKGIRTAIWGDHLLSSVRGKDFRTWKTSTGYEYKIPAALTATQVNQMIPKDILIFNWFWKDPDNDRQVADFGFSQLYGNLRPLISQWKKRASLKGVMGGAPSSWAASTEFNIGKDQLFDFLGCAGLLWSGDYYPEGQLPFAVSSLISGIYSRLSGKVLPSDDGADIRPLNLSSRFNACLSRDVPGMKDVRMKTGDVRLGNKRFHLDSNTSGTNALVLNDRKDENVPVASVHEDVSSILFLQACTRGGVNRKSYGRIYDFEDTAEPLGWYEVLYEDGLSEVVPLRYGVNILDWQWRQRINRNDVEIPEYNQDKYAYRAAPLECGQPGSEPLEFFAFEWENTRYGEKVREIRFHSAINEKGKNQVILVAVSMALNKTGINASGHESQ